MNESWVRVDHLEEIGSNWAKVGHVMGNLAFSQDHLQSGWSDTL